MHSPTRVRLYVLPNSDKAAAICHLNQLLCDEADIEKAINNKKFKGWLLQATQPKEKLTPKPLNFGIKEITRTKLSSLKDHDKTFVETKNMITKLASVSAGEQKSLLFFLFCKFDTLDLQTDRSGRPAVQLWQVERGLYLHTAKDIRGGLDKLPSYFNLDIREAPSDKGKTWSPLHLGKIWKS